MTGVKLPVKLEKLSVEFYKDKDFVLDNSKRFKQEINYNF